MKICGDFNIDPKECEWPAKRFENAMKEQVKELESCGNMNSAISIVLIRFWRTITYFDDQD